MSSINCSMCRFMTKFTAENNDYVLICTAEEPDGDDGFFQLVEVGDGEHPNCLMRKATTGINT